MTLRGRSNSGGLVRKRSLALYESGIEALERRQYLTVSFGMAANYGDLNTANYTSVQVADLNGDGKPDIVAYGSSGTLTVFPNIGGGKFGPGITLLSNSATAQDASFAIGDFNGDGVPDIALCTQTDGIQVFLGAATNVNGANPSFLAPVTTTVAGGFSLIQMGYFGGSSADLVGVDDNGLAVLPSTGAGQFGTPIEIKDSHGNVVNAANATFVVADFSGDGISDIAYSDVTSINLQFGESGGGFEPGILNYPITVDGGEVERLYAGALTNSGENDLVALIEDPGIVDSDLNVFLNNGGGTFASAADYSGGTGDVIALGDFNGDGSLDIAEQDPNVGVAIYTNTGAGAFEAPVPASLSSDADPFSFVAADVNGDGHADIIDADTEVGVYLEGAANSGGGGGGGGSGGADFTTTLTGRLPTTTLIAGGKNAVISQSIKITNTSGATVHGPMTVSVTLDGTSVFSTARTVNLHNKISLTIPFSIRSIPSGLDGTFNLVAQVTDPSGNVISATSAATVTIAPPIVDLSGSFVHLPATVKAGKKATVTLTVMQNGNVPVKASLPIDVKEDDENGNVIDLGIIPKSINILAGHHGIVTLVLTMPTTGGPYFLDANLDPENTLGDVNLANNVFTSAVAIRLT